jgi:hypothetical protein
MRAFDGECGRMSDHAVTSIDGLSVAAATEAVAARTDDDAETVRATLESVAEDGVVSHAGVESALAHAAKVVSTPETRLEHASLRVADAREAADPVAHLDGVAARLDDFDARLAAVEERVEDLGSELRALVDGDGGIYERAVGIRRLTAAANATQQAADELAVDAEDFEAWVRDPSRRVDELAEEADAVEAYVDDCDADAGSPEAWLDATLRQRVAALLVSDLRADVADLRAWPDGDAVDADALDDLTARLDGLDETVADLRADLADAARPDWRERYGDRVAAFEADLDALDSPVDWGTVRRLLDDYR